MAATTAANGIFAQLANKPPGNTAYKKQNNVGEKAATRRKVCHQPASDQAEKQANGRRNDVIQRPGVKENSLFFADAVGATVADGRFDGAAAANGLTAVVAAQ